MIPLRFLKVVPVALGLALAPWTMQLSFASTSVRATALPAVAQCGQKAETISKPTTIGYACGDLGGVASNITWSKYTATTAVGVGRLTYNTCTPACFDGNDLLYTVNITLTRPVKFHGHVVFQSMAMTPVTGKNPSLKSSLPGAGWGSVPA